MDVKELQDFLYNASKDELTELVTRLNEHTGFERICDRLQELITLY